MTCLSITFNRYSIWGIAKKGLSNVNILQHKSNHTMKSGQLIEYDNRNIFLQKSCEK